MSLQCYLFLFLPSIFAILLSILSYLFLQPFNKILQLIILALLCFLWFQYVLYLSMNYSHYILSPKYICFINLVLIITILFVNIFKCYSYVLVTNNAFLYLNISAIRGKVLIHITLIPDLAFLKYFSQLQVFLSFNGRKKE